MVNILQINKLMITLSDLSDSNIVVKDILLAKLSDVLLNSEQSTYSLVLETCIDLGLVDIDGNGVRSTATGLDYLAIMTTIDDKYYLDANDEQRNFILNLVTGSDKLRHKLKPTIDKFVINFSAKPKTWFLPTDTRWPAGLDELLIDIKFMSWNDDKAVVEPDVTHVLSSIKHNQKISKNEFTKILEQKKITGEIAEELTIESEKRRLVSEGREDLATIIQQVSDVDVGAGYDIVSFDGKNSVYVHDRFIEVKGTSGNSDIFYWSKNEMDAAKKLGNKYWIYFWKHVGASDKTAELKKINDPYDKFWIRTSIKPEPLIYKVRSDQI